MPDVVDLEKSEEHRVQFARDGMTLENSAKWWKAMLD